MQSMEWVQGQDPCSCYLAAFNWNSLPNTTTGMSHPLLYKAQKGKGTRPVVVLQTVELVTKHNYSDGPPPVVQSTAGQRGKNYSCAANSGTCYQTQPLGWTTPSVQSTEGQRGKTCGRAADSGTHYQTQLFGWTTPSCTKHRTAEGQDLWFTAMELITKDNH